jgi:hypothetical protein
MEGRPLDRVPPLVGTGGEPVARRCGVTAGCVVEQLTVADELGEPPPAPVRAGPHERGLEPRWVS